MIKKWTETHPYITAVGYALICTLLTSIGVAATQVAQVDGSAAYLVMTGAVVASVLVGLLLIRLGGLSAAGVGLRLSTADSIRRVWFYLPLLLIECIPLLVYGPVFSESLAFYATLALFTLAVGLNEELYFRGLILTVLKSLGHKRAVIVSALLFGLLHAANILANDTDLWGVLLQIAFAIIFGLVLALIVILTQSLWVVMLWHGLHNFLSFSTEKQLDQLAYIVVSLQIIVLLIYLVVLWRKVRLVP